MTHIFLRARQIHGNPPRKSFVGRSETLETNRTLTRSSWGRQQCKLKRIILVWTRHCFISWGEGGNNPYKISRKWTTAQFVSFTQKTVIETVGLKIWFITITNYLPPSDAVRKQNKNILEDLFSSVLSQFQKCNPSENLKFNDLGIFQSLKLRTLVEKNPSIFS